MLELCGVAIELQALQAHAGFPDLSSQQVAQVADVHKVAQIATGDKGAPVQLLAHGNVAAWHANARPAIRIGVVAEIVTPFGNRLLKYNKIDLPYSDLK